MPATRIFSNKLTECDNVALVVAQRVRFARREFKRLRKRRDVNRVRHAPPRPSFAIVR
jgi:hypothetical protein